MIKPIKIFHFLIILCVISCNDQENRKNVTTTSNKNNIVTNKIIPDLFDKKYFHGYQLSPDSDYPIYTHTDKNNGDLTVDFINKNFENQKEWISYDTKNNLFAGDDPDDKYFNDLNKIIKKKLDPNLNDYEIIAEYIPAKYIESKNLDYIYPYIKQYFLYNKEKKSWNFLKQKTITDGSNEKNITKLAELNAMLNISRSNNLKNVKKNNANGLAILIEKIDGTWSTDCKSENSIFISSTINHAQFTCVGRFSVNAQLKEISKNKYELYFTDFPPIIPLPKEMQNWQNLDNKKPVGYLEIKSESEIILNWFGFYYKKTNKYTQTENLLV